MLAVYSLFIFCPISELCSWVLEETVRFCNQLKVILIDSRSISFYAMACASERIHAHAEKVIISLIWAYLSYAPLI